MDDNETFTYSEEVSSRLEYNCHVGENGEIIEEIEGFIVNTHRISYEEAEELLN